MHILIVTPILPPQIGGPGLYASRLGAEFEKNGHSVQTISFGAYLKYPVIIRHFMFIFYVLRNAIGMDIIFTLDNMNVGFAGVFASFILRRPLVLRLEGDPLWEHYVERTREDVPLSMLYSKDRAFSLKERIMAMMSALAIRQSSGIAVSSEWRRQIAAKSFQILPDRMVKIQNTFPFVEDRGQADQKREKTIVWAGRMLYLKNLYRLIDAFHVAKNEEYKLCLIGDGPERLRLEQYVEEKNIMGVIFQSSVVHEELLTRLSTAAFLVLPSVSDISPNIIADAMSVGTPFLMTKETGYSEFVHDLDLLIDPLDTNDIAKKMQFLMNEENQQQKVLTLSSLRPFREWDEAAREWLELFERVLSR